MKLPMRYYIVYLPDGSVARTDYSHSELLTWLRGYEVYHYSSDGLGQATLHVKERL